MRRLLGFTLFFIGVGLGAYIFLPRTPTIVPLADASRGEMLVLRSDGDPAGLKQVRVASPQMPLFVPIAPPQRITAPEPVTSAGTAPSRTDTAKAPVPPAWQVDVAFEPVARPPVQPVTAPLPRDPYMLIRELQSELKRVGCYDGRVDGSWGPASKRAMTEFTDRVNATLPVEEPDAVLLTLLRGQNARVCGNVCLAGQAVAADGTCVSNSLLVDAEGKPRPERRKAQRIAAPPRATAKRAVQMAADPATSTATAPVMQPLPSTPYPARPEPLPGRMAIGAPMAGDRLGAAPYTSPDVSGGAGVRVPFGDEEPVRQAEQNATAPVAPPAVKSKRHASQYAAPEKRKRKRIVAYDLFLGPNRMGN